MTTTGEHHRPAALCPAHSLVLLCAMLLQPWAEILAGETAAPQSGSLLLRMQNGYRVATRLDTRVDMRISGTVARVSVSQTFRNDGTRWVEGVYVFPLPDDAAVDRLRLRAGERLVEGKIRATEQAKSAYDAALSEGRRAALVSRQRSNLFTTAVANIAPGEVVTVDVGYLQIVKYEDGIFSLRFPTAITPRYMPGMPLADRPGGGWAADTDDVPDASLISPPAVANSTAHELALRASIDAGLPLELVASRYHPIEISSKDALHIVTLKDSQAQTDHDFELSWRPARNVHPQPALFAEILDGQTHISLLLMPPTVGAPDADVPQRDLTFVIDTSGSMHGTSLAQARRAVSRALAALRPRDRFNVVQFNSVTEQLFPDSVPATDANVAKAIDWVLDLEANGGTEMRPALLAALRQRDTAGLRQVVFVTDGAVGNEEQLYELIAAHLGETRLFTVGIGSAPNGWFMRKAARQAAAATSLSAHSTR